MKKYEVCTDSFEFNPTKTTDIQHSYFEQNETDQKLIKLCDSLEEALEVLAKFTPYTRRYSYSLARAEIAYISSAEYEYDEDFERWEFIDGFDVEHFAFAPLEEEEEEEAEDNEEDKDMDLTTVIYKKIFNRDEDHEGVNNWMKAVIINFGDERGDIIVSNDNFGTDKPYANFTNGKKAAGLHPMEIVFRGLDFEKLFGDRYINADDEICLFKDLK